MEGADVLRIRGVRHFIRCNGDKEGYSGGCIEVQGYYG